jgi:hypothetical protein
MAIQTPIAPTRGEREQRDVTSWRIERLAAAGYPADAALVLALDREVDLHLAVSLLERGCPADTALEILF